MFGFGVQEIIVLAILGGPIVLAVVVYLIVKAARRKTSKWADRRAGGQSNDERK